MTKRLSIDELNKIKEKLDKSLPGRWIADVTDPHLGPIPLICNQKFDEDGDEISADVIGVTFTGANDQKKVASIFPHPKADGSNDDTLHVANAQAIEALQNNGEVLVNMAKEAIELKEIIQLLVDVGLHGTKILTEKEEIELFDKLLSLAE